MTQDTPTPSPPSGHAQQAKAAPLEPERLEPVAALLAMVFPGAGHIFLGEAKRGVLLMIGVLGLFFGGVFIGGIDVIDSKEDRIWFVGQAFIGPLTFAADYYHQNKIKVSGRSGPRSALPDENPRNEKSLGKMNEIGTLYVTIGGMLNLIIILDAGFHRRWPEGKRR